jgi:hypothetical protein
MSKYMLFFIIFFENSKITTTISLHLLMDFSIGICPIILLVINLQMKLSMKMFRR